MTTANGGTADDADSTNPVSVRLVSIARGVVENNNNGEPIIECAQSQRRRQLSWSDFQAMQERISALEQRNRDEEEKIGLLGREVLTTDDDDKDKKVLDVTGRVTNTRRSARRLTASEVEALFDNYELPSDTYSLLLTSDIISIPFFTGIVGCFLSLFALALAFKNEWDNGSAGNVSLFVGTLLFTKLCMYQLILVAYFFIAVRIACRG